MKKYLKRSILKNIKKNRKPWHKRRKMRRTTKPPFNKKWVIWILRLMGPYRISCRPPRIWRRRQRKGKRPWAKLRRSISILSKNMIICRRKCWKRPKMKLWCKPQNKLKSKWRSKPRRNNSKRRRNKSRRPRKNSENSNWKKLGSRQKLTLESNTKSRWNTSKNSSKNKRINSKKKKLRPKPKLMLRQPERKESKSRPRPKLKRKPKPRRPRMRSSRNRLRFWRPTKRRKKRKPRPLGVLLNWKENNFSMKAERNNNWLKTWNCRRGRRNKRKGGLAPETSWWST